MPLRVRSEPGAAGRGREKRIKRGRGEGPREACFDNLRLKSEHRRGAK